MSQLFVSDEAGRRKKKNEETPCCFAVGGTVAPGCIWTPLWSYTEPQTDSQFEDD